MIKYSLKSGCIFEKYLYIITVMKNVYIKCPRCDLNFILKKDKLCPVCKQEMQALNANLADEDVSLCPICKVNYVTEDENVCGTCMGETDLSEEEIDALYGGIVAGEKEVSEEDTSDDEEELEMLSMEIEGESNEDEAEDDEEEESADPLDDFDDSLDDDDEEDEEDYKEED